MASTDPSAETLRAFLAAAKQAAALRDAGKDEEEEGFLELMDSMWDRMSTDMRAAAEDALRQEGLGAFADQIRREQDEL